MDMEMDNNQNKKLFGISFKTEKQFKTFIDTKEIIDKATYLNDTINFINETKLTQDKRLAIRHVVENINNHYKINPPTKPLFDSINEKNLVEIMKYTFVFTEFLSYYKHTNLIDYDKLCTIMIANNFYRHIPLIFDNIKLSQDSYDKIVDNIGQHGDFNLIKLCYEANLVPTREQTFKLIEYTESCYHHSKTLDQFRIIIEPFIELHNINKDGGKYIAIFVKNDTFNLKSKKIYNFTDEEKQEIKKALFNNTHPQLTDKMLETYKKMFKLEYDLSCIKMFCEYETEGYAKDNIVELKDYKIFKYLVNQGTKPDYDMFCHILKGVKTRSQLTKFI